MAQKCKILIIEDELITRQALRYIIGLEGDNFEIIGEACNGKEAQGLIAKNEPHIVICDIVMPVMDGIELTKYIKLKYPQIYILILSSYGNFDYVKSTFQYGVFDYILKPQLEPEILLSTLYRACKCLNIENHLVEKETNEPQTDYVYPCFYMMGYKLEKIKGYRKNKASFYLEVISDKIESYFKDIVHETLFTEEDCFIVMLNFDRNASNYVEECIEAMAKELYSTNADLRMAMGEIFEDIECKQERIDDIRDVLALQFYLPAHQFIMRKNPHGKYNRLSFNQREYIDKISRGLYKEAFEMIKSFLYLIDEKYRITEEELKKMLEHTLYNTLGKLEEMDFDIQEISSQKLSLFNEINKTYSIEELRCCIDNIIHRVTKILDEQKKVENIIVSKMYEYIDKHYNEQITLNTLASIFHLSYSYLSGYFSSFTNKGFNEYLNEVRIDKAKELLCHSDYSISDISEKVGYADQSYFSKVFKKLTSYSPSEYRKIHLR